MDPLSRITPATLDVLDALLTGTSPLWGLLVVKQTGRPAGSVYPILERLEGAGWVTSEWEVDPERSGPRRRLYELTPDGGGAARAALATARSRTESKPQRTTRAAQSAGLSAARPRGLAVGTPA